MRPYINGVRELTKSTRHIAILTNVIAAFVQDDVSQVSVRANLRSEQQYNVTCKGYIL